MRLKTVLCAAAAAAIAVTPTDAIGIAVTEIHRDPAAGNKTAVPGGYSHSFVELTNFGSDTFFFKDVFLTNGKAVDSITLFDSPIAAHETCRFNAGYLPPGGIAIILPQNYTAGLEAAPASAHPIADGTTILTVNRKNLCGGLANDDGIALYRGTRARIDSLIDLAADPDVHISAPLSGKIVLSVKQPKGTSVAPASLVLGERRYIAMPPSDPLTPGRYGPLRDGIFTEHSASMLADGTTVRCSTACVFVTESGENASWRFYSSTAGADGVSGKAVMGGGVFGGQRLSLLAHDIADPKPLSYIFEIAVGGSRTITVPIDLSNFWAAAGSVRITEIYPRGSPAAGQPEWFELQNAAPAAVNLNGWAFGRPPDDTAALAATDLLLPPGQFMVVTKDPDALCRKYRCAGARVIKPARWITLNNNADTIAVFSSHGVTADKAVYRSSWFSGWTAQSIERVPGAGGADPASWTLCPTPTPGFPGGAAAWRAVSAPSMEIGPTPFRPSGRGADRYLSIRLKAPPNSRATVKIFAFDGKLLKTFADCGEAAMWDGKTDKARPAAPGPIYIIAEFTTGGLRTSVRKNGILWR